MRFPLYTPVTFELQIGRWPAGTRGVIVDYYDHGYMIEIADDEGQTLAVVEAAASAIEHPRVHTAPGASAAREALRA